MDILTEYNFKRPSRSQYAKVAKALVEDNAPIVKLKRGEDFSENAAINGVQGAVSETIRKAGRKARTFVESQDVLIVTLWPEGEGPQRRSKKTKQAVSA